MNQSLDEIKVRRISTEEALTNPGVFIEAVEEAIKDFLDKKQCELIVSDAHYINGINSFTIAVRQKPEITEDN